MRAIVVREFGGPEVLRIEEVPDPAPGAGELLVRVAAAGIQFIETQTRAGTMQGTAGSPEAAAADSGREVAGEVLAVGDGVPADWIGRRVSGVTVPTAGGPGGGYAELAVVQAESSHRLPDTLDYADAVSLLGTGRTALGLVEQAEVGKGDTVLVEGATGAVGVLSMQLARAAGAERVIALVRGSEKAQLATGRPAAGHPPKHRAGLPAHPQDPPDLQRQRLRGRLRRRSAGRHRLHPPAGHVPGARSPRREAARPAENARASQVRIVDHHVGRGLR